MCSNQSVTSILELFAHCSVSVSILANSRLSWNERMTITRHDYLESKASLAQWTSTLVHVEEHRNCHQFCIMFCMFHNQSQSPLFFCLPALAWFFPLSFLLTAAVNKELQLPDIKICNGKHQDISQEFSVRPQVTVGNSIEFVLCREYCTFWIKINKTN